MLDVLRSLRHSYSSSLRMILTGSIGLHYVLSKLKHSGYVNALIKDLAPVEVGPLMPESGRELAYRLLCGEGISGPALNEAATLISEQVDHFTYYIQHLVRRLKMECEAATPATIKTIIQAQLVDPNDPWKLKHYRERITIYCGKDEPLVIAILDALAVADSPMAQDTLFTNVKSAEIFHDREHFQEILNLLERDHYMRRNDRGRYHFRFGVIRRWWQFDRRLTS